MPLEFDYQSTLEGPWPDTLEVIAGVHKGCILWFQAIDLETDHNWAFAIQKAEDKSELKAIYQAILDEYDEQNAQV